jgi:flagellar biosynthesis protein FlhB
MAEQNQELDQSEPATPFKLEKAHERGSIVRSTEVVFASVLLAAVACVYGLGTQVLNDVALLVRRGLSFTGRDDLGNAAALAYVQALTGGALRAIAPVIFVVWLAALLTAGLQARGVFTAFPLKPDFTRLNPATGLKRILSLKSLHELWRSVAKIAVIGAAIIVWGRQHIDDVLRLAGQNPRAMAHGGLALLGSCLTLLTAIVLVFALLDWGLNRWEFMRKMRMSKREIKDEHKQREGDPRIKSRLRELRMQWLQRARALAKVRSADVLLTNPTHYAVALEYRHGEMPAPMITARGAGEMAQRMRAEAHRRAVPVVENAPLARALFALRESQLFVPEEHFGQVARVLRWVFAARASRQAGQVSS